MCYKIIAVDVVLVIFIAFSLTNIDFDHVSFDFYLDPLDSKIGNKLWKKLY